MREFLSDLRIDVAAIERDRSMCAGIAFGHRNRAEKAEQSQTRRDHFAFAATDFRRAAAHSLLLGDTAGARRLFGEASRDYARLGLPYAVMMSALAFGSVPKDSMDFLRVLNETAHSQMLPRALVTQLVYAAIADAATEGHVVTPGLQAILHDLAASESSPIGILGLPLGAYLDLAKAFTGGNASFEEVLAPFLATYDNAIRHANQNAYHWRYASLPFHPVEPDVLAVLVLSHTRMPVREIVAKFPLAWASRTILDSALHQLLSSR